VTRSLHVIGSPQMGGAERFYVRLVRALNEAGNEHRALAAVRPGSPVAEALPPEIERFCIGMRGGWDLLSAYQLRTLIGRLKIPIVQTYMGRATKLTRVPEKSGTVHIARLGGYYKIQGYYTHAHAWIGNTRGICDYLIREGRPASRVFEIGNFVELPTRPPADELSRLRQSLDLPREAWLMFSLGRFIPKKGFHILLRAWAALPKEIAGRPPVLVVGGTGPMETRLREQAAQLGLKDRVKWLGWLTDPAPYLFLSDGFVCPSLDEPLGNVILEAWAAECPVVSTRTKGAEELIVDGHNGLIAPCEDAKQLAGQLERLLTADQSLRLQLAQNGHRLVRVRFSKSEIVQRYLELYRNLGRE
jgi:glycosyltransferase involved in cell wall biosynthesis